MANRRNVSQFLQSFYRKPTLVVAKFTVQKADAGGAGCTGFSLPGAGGFGQPNSSTTNFGLGVNQVFMSSSSAAATNYCVDGQIAVQLADNYRALIGVFPSFSNVVTGAAVNISAGLTLGNFYQIVTLGTSTTANWQAVGVPAGVTPVVGLTFQASTSSAGTGTGTVKALTFSNIDHIELAGDPNVGSSGSPSNILNPVGQASGFNGGVGGWLYFSMWKAGVLTQPTNGTVITLNMLLEGA